MLCFSLSETLYVPEVCVQQCILPAFEIIPKFFFVFPFIWKLVHVDSCRTLKQVSLFFPLSFPSLSFPLSLKKEVQGQVCL